MRNYITTVVLVTIFLWLFTGCTNSTGPANPTDPDLREPASISNAPVLWGIWDVRLSESGECEAVPIRQANFTLNAVGWLNASPGNLGLWVDNVNPHTGYTDFILDVSITHPFDTATKFTGFDVCGVLMGNGELSHPFDSTLLYGGSDSQQLTNADGHTRWMNYPEFNGTDPQLLGYISGVRGTGDYFPSATLCPYKYFCDNLEATGSAYSYLTGNPSDRGYFSVGTTNSRKYHVRIPDAVGLQFQYAVVARWEPNNNAPDPPESIPDDFPPEANAAEAVILEVLNDESDMYWDGSTGGGNFTAEISVVNWFVQPGTLSVVDDYEIQCWSDAWSGGISPDMTAIDFGDNYCTFAIDIPASPTSTGTLPVWITVSYPGLTYENQFGVPTGADDATLAAHFLYSAAVGTGSEWEPPTDHDPRFLFIHHSTGSGFLFQGGMWDLLEDAGFEVHNRTYGDGWVGDNTDPPDWPITFTEYYEDMITWEMDAGEYYDIVAFKSCYPASNISSDAMLEAYKGYYNTVKSVTQQHPETLFVPYTTPPLVPGATNPENAARAREFSIWLTGEYLEGEGNLAAYNVFNILAGDDPDSGDFNCLRYDYQIDPGNSHPNALGNTTVAQDFTDWLVDVVWD